MLRTEFGLQRLQGFPCVCLYTTSFSSTPDIQTACARITVHRHSRNGIYLDFLSGTNPTRHVDIRTCPLRDIGPPRLRSRAVDTNCPTARRCACVMRPDSESRCRVADGVVDHCGRPIRARRCRDWLAGLAAKRATPCSVTPLRAG